MIGAWQRSGVDDDLNTGESPSLVLRWLVLLHFLHALVHGSPGISSLCGFAIDGSIVGGMRSSSASE